MQPHLKLKLTAKMAALAIFLFLMLNLEKMPNCRDFT